MALPSLVEQMFPAEGAALHVAVGPANGPPLVVLHGVTRRWDDWIVLVPHLSATWQVHAFDHVGHGRSGRAPMSYRVVDYVPGIIAYLETLAEPAVVVGHSLGAMVAAAVAARCPSKVRGLVLEDPTFEMTGSRIDETGFPALFQAFARHAGSTRMVSDIARDLASTDVIVPGRKGPVPLATLRDHASLRYTAACLRRLDPAVLPVILEGRWLEGYDVLHTLSRVLCPALFLHGDFNAGGALPDDYAQELASEVPDVVPIKLPGAPHNIHTSMPEAMLRFLLPFLASLR
jgi:pimeloyl-ACP methyl ester carboxylesterase